MNLKSIISFYNCILYIMSLILMIPIILYNCVIYILDFLTPNKIRNISVSGGRQYFKDKTKIK